MNVTMVETSSVFPHSENPRKNDAAVDVVAKSIQKFGFRQPIVVDRSMVVIAGHTRLKAAIRLGLKQIPVYIASDMTEEEAKAYRIADNQTATISEWDEDLLAKQIAELANVSFDLSSLGFDGKELDRLLDIANPPAQSDGECEIPPPKVPVCKKGDRWILGDHVLLCGDARSPEDVAKLMGEEKADMLLIDPPYGVAYVGKTEDQLEIQNDKLNAEELTRFLSSSFKAVEPQLKKGSAFYVWHADSIRYPFLCAFLECGWTVRQLLVWVKNVFTFGRQDYQWKHEPCFYGWIEGAPHTWLSGRNLSTVLEFNKPSKNDVHPTMKPVALFEHLIKNSCNIKGIVLDVFCGSGTTVVACQNTNRKARVMELDPAYCDVIIERWKQATGGTPVLDSDQAA